MEHIAVPWGVGSDKFAGQGSRAPHRTAASSPALRAVSTRSTAPDCEATRDHRPRRGQAGTTRYAYSPGKCLRPGREQGPR